MVLLGALRFMVLHGVAWCYHSSFAILWGQIRMHHAVQYSTHRPHTNRRQPWVLLASWLQVWYWGSLEELRKTAKASPVFNLEGAYDFHSKEYDWPDFIVRVKTNLHDSPVRAFMAISTFLVPL
jgi:hypothetical protein